MNVMCQQKHSKANLSAEFERAQSPILSRSKTSIYAQIWLKKNANKVHYDPGPTLLYSCTAHKKKDTIHQILYNSFYSTMHIASARGEIQRKGRLSQFLGHAWPITADGRGLAKG